MLNGKMLGFNLHEKQDLKFKPVPGLVCGLNTISYMPGSAFIYKLHGEDDNTCSGLPLFTGVMY